MAEESKKSPIRPFNKFRVVLSEAEGRQAQSMKVKIDQNLCIGCGTCVALCPEVFELKKDGKAYVKNPADCSKCDCQAVKESCPVEAILLQN